MYIDGLCIRVTSSRCLSHMGNAICMIVLYHVMHAALELDYVYVTVTYFTVLYCNYCLATVKGYDPYHKLKCILGTSLASPFFSQTGGHIPFLCL